MKIDVYDMIDRAINLGIDRIKTEVEQISQCSSKQELTKDFGSKVVTAIAVKID